MVELTREMPKLLKNKRITVQLDDDHFDHLQRLAWTHQVSISYLGHLAVLKLLLEDVRGTFTLVPEFQDGQDLHNA